ncbi:hypothetical protein Taro_015911, partial [Colocasia esculenta]|nr:hypothetical protein [Colocasia esculenta]
GSFWFDWRRERPVRAGSQNPQLRFLSLRLRLPAAAAARTPPEKPQSIRFRLLPRSSGAAGAWRPHRTPRASCCGISISQLQSAQKVLVFRQSVSPGVEISTLISEVLGVVGFLGGGHWEKGVDSVEIRVLSSGIIEMNDKRPKEEIAEDYCFVCKDGGKLLICEHGDCLKACHPQCVGKDESFFETGHRWTCGWHTCFICHKSSEYQCFCCPTSVCGACIIATDFVQLRKTKGFCSNCLKLLILAEENAEVDSDGCKLDFGNTETSEFLFKDYWHIIKEQEKLNIEDLREAESLLKKGENYKDIYISGQILEDEGELTSDTEYVNKSYNNEMTFPGDKVLRKRRKRSVKRFRFTKGNCTSWGSVELIEFLTSLGKDIAEPLKQWDVAHIIENYVNEKNLLHPNRKKKTVLCDDKLRSLFRKKTVRLVKIYKLLEGHFAENLDSDDSEFGSEDDAEPEIEKKLNKNSQAMRRNKTEKVHDPHKIYYASMIDKNIKLVYLRRSLVKELLENPDLETFEKKVVGCFVRVKNDPRDFEFPPDKRYLLRQVSGIKSTTDVYTVGEISTGIVLRVSNIWKDVRISMLSEDDFEEEEFEDLHQLVKKGLFKQPTVEELEEKVRSVHEDIMKHWIKRELFMLQKRIDRANEKGWFREYPLSLKVGKREQVRLLTEIPEVIPDIQGLEDMSNPQTDSQKESKGLKEIPEVIRDTHEFGDMANPQVDFLGESKGAKKIPEVTPDVKISEIANPQMDFHIESMKSDPSGEATEAKTEGKQAALPEEVTNDEGTEGQPESTDAKESFKEIAVIEIDDDDDDEPPRAMAKALQVSNLQEAKPIAFGEKESIWHYLDPSGRVQGPFPMSSLMYWKSQGFFGDSFKVWRTGQSPRDAMSLREAFLLPKK